MKVVHISTTDFGGAYIAAANISRAINECGAESKVIVREKYTGGEVSVFCDTHMKWLRSKAGNFLNLLCSKGDIINDVFGSDITSMKEVQEADVIILHWANSFISYKVLEKICSMHKPVFQVMHDMWCFTGGCHYDAGCAGYINHCMDGRRCGIPAQKSAVWQETDITYIGPSRWITECARKSSLLKDHKCICVKNPVDTEVFRPDGRKHAGKKVILFGAMIASDRRKGLDLLLRAIERLDVNKYRIVIFGNTDGMKLDDIKMEHLELGSLHGTNAMAAAYNMADVFVIPSRQENLSNSVTEALSCGIPVAAFNIGGMEDMVESHINGYLARPLDVDDLAEGIRYCAENKESLGIKAREKAEKEFSMKVIGEQYVRLCREVCKIICK